MSSLHKHFYTIKAIVDWSWTLAILCLLGYITLGQLVQLYWAMVVFGSVAGSFGLFYEFSCQKLAELDSLDADQLREACILSSEAQILLNKFAKRNPNLVLQSPVFTQAQQRIEQAKIQSYTKHQERVNEFPRSPQRQDYNSQTDQIPQQKNRSNDKVVVTPSKKQSARRRNSIPNSSKPKITESEYKIISNRDDYVYVRGYHKSNGTWVEPHYRRKPRY